MLCTFQCVYLLMYMNSGLTFVFLTLIKNKLSDHAAQLLTLHEHGRGGAGVRPSGGNIAVVPGS